MDDNDDDDDNDNERISHGVGSNMNVMGRAHGERGRARYEVLWARGRARIQRVNSRLAHPGIF